MTHFLAGILTGVFISLANQVAAALLTKPILDIRELIGEISASLIYHSNVYGPAVREERKVEAHEAFRGQASRLRAKANALFFPGVWSALRLVPKRSNFVDASNSLFALSYYTRQTAESSEASLQAGKLEDQIRKLLHIQGS